jgi:prepilin-type N-terminal cleavage/methylation domain-containing protein
MRREDRTGFTLIEVLVALTIGAVVLLGARALLDGLSTSATAALHGARAADARANGEWIARQVIGNMALAPDTITSFAGSPREAVFSSWCPSTHGELEPCTVRLFIRGSATADLVLSRSGGSDVTVLTGVTNARLRYLSRADNGGAWQSEWRTAIDTPLAIGVTTDRDTLLLRVGERR